MLANPIGRLPLHCIPTFDNLRPVGRLACGAYKIRGTEPKEVKGDGMSTIRGSCKQFSISKNQDMIGVKMQSIRSGILSFFGTRGNDTETHFPDLLRNLPLTDMRRLQLVSRSGPPKGPIAELP